MILPIFTGTTDVDEFVKLWSQFYDYGKEDVYQTVITQREITETDLELLFTWKSNTGQTYEQISKGKRTFVERVKARLAKINHLKEDFSIDYYRHNFDDLPTVWGVLLLHAIRPEEFPIFDQHVYRAYCFLTTGTFDKLSASHKRNYEVYYGEYKQFFDSLYQRSQSCSRKNLDDALWAFGRLLSKSKTHQPVLVK